MKSINTMKECSFFYNAGVNVSTFAEFMLKYTVSQKKRKKRKRNTPIYFNTNYRLEMKLVPIVMDYCLLQFDVLKFFLKVRLHGRGGDVST